MLAKDASGRRSGNRYRSIIRAKQIKTHAIRSNSGWQVNKQKRVSDGGAPVPSLKLRTAVLESASRIRDYLCDHHLRDGVLIGPDPGVRFNYRYWRFLKSCAPRINWGDDLCYMQTQGYWIISNGRWAELNAECESESAAIAASSRVVELQRNDGAWNYPNPEWRGRVATVEGLWAALGLLESYQRNGEQRFLDAVLRWHRFFEEQIGFQEFDGNIAVNYFANDCSEPVPNNSALALRYFTNMANATGDASYLNRCEGLLHFICNAQLPSGEVPYIYGDSRRVHFQCFQYQAFLYLDVLAYYRSTGNDRARILLAAILGFLKNGVSPEGYAYYQCRQKRRTVNYHTGAVAAALSTATEVGETGYDKLANKAFRYLLRQQRDDGSIPHSQRDYGVLSDHRAYPRYLAMMLFHLVTAAQDRQAELPDNGGDRERSRIVVEGSA